MKDWQSALVTPTATIADAMTTLDNAALRIVLVVDAERKLLGTLTDGDIRRGLLARKGLDTAVTEVMNSQPKVGYSDWSLERLQRWMEKHQVLQLPILNEQGTVTRLETLQSLLSRPQYDNAVFLMAGGFGTRLRPLTQDCPKPMLEVGGKPILQVILEGFVNAGFQRFYISTHYKPEMITSHFGDGSHWGVDIRYVHEDKPLGTAGALGLLRAEQLSEPLFMMNGDLLTNLDYRKLLDFHQQCGGVATMCVRQHEFQIPYGVVRSDGHQATGIVEKPVSWYDVNAGIYLISPELIERVPLQQRIDMPDLLTQEIEQQRQVNVFPLQEYWLDIGRMEDFKRAQSEFEQL
ncbi:nucleotidyltransferase family protein [Idiomarina xiamenensis]|uniref:Nucleotidyl transferase n=1 Tax=Idiomarina xiamenensis 10-D-4 TaxID=740709 RepID=K2KT74_9GAMM|nr:nucleotidyltransferase family protein [Idiomarina xiamenensis]EKE80840.1 nucleotidyl transferase [Idiomarina xiamenensis 10-D-4]